LVYIYKLSGYILPPYLICFLVHIICKSRFI